MKPLLVTPTINPGLQWQGYLRHVNRAINEATLSAWPLLKTKRLSPGAGALMSAIGDLAECDGTLDPSDYVETASELFWADLGRRPLKDVVLDNLSVAPPTNAFPEEALPPGQAENAEVIHNFLQRINHKDLPLIPFLFPTRPLSASELTECVAETCSNLPLLRSLVRALRGTWVGTSRNNDNHAENGNVIEIGIPEKEQDSDRSNQLPD